jgi:hypothetical protein
VIAARPASRTRRGGRAALLVLAAAVLAGAQADVTAFPECGYCGMERKAFGFARMVVSYEDGSSAGVCSLHCAVTEMGARSGKPVRKLEVADRNSLELLDASAATWVLGGAKRGVMSTRAKWAFGTRAAAEAFVKKYGGEIVPWERALAAAREDVAAAEAQERARTAGGLGCSGPSRARRADHEEPTPTPTPSPTERP